MLPTEGGEHIFRKYDDILEKKVLEAWKAQRKQQIVYEINKIVASMHTVIFADRALKAKNAQVMGHNQNFEGGTERKKSEPNEPRDDKSKQK